MVTVATWDRIPNQMTSSYPRVPLSSLNWLGSGLISFGVFCKDPRGLGLCFFLALISPFTCPYAPLLSSCSSSEFPGPCSVVFLFSLVGVLPVGESGVCCMASVGLLDQDRGDTGDHVLRMGKMLC